MPFRPETDNSYPNFIQVMLTLYILYLLPAIRNDDVADQFSFRPTGSTTAVFIYILHHVTLLLETNEYVRCLLVDFSKAIDTVNHFIIIKKLQKLDIPTIVINWIIHFLTDRTLQVVINGRRSSRLSVTRSIVQGSGLGSLLFLIYILDLKTICNINILCRYADDLSQLRPQYSPSDLVGEFSHIVRWAEANRLIINRSKTKDIVFRRPSLRHYISPPPLMQIEQVRKPNYLASC